MTGIFDPSPNQVPHFWEISVEGGGTTIWLPIYFQVLISFQILTEDADGDRDAQMKMTPIRGSENLAGAADG